MGILIFTVFKKSQIWLIFSLSEKQFSLPDEDQWSNLDLTELPEEYRVLQNKLIIDKIITENHILGSDKINQIWDFLKTMKIRIPVLYLQIELECHISYLKVKAPTLPTEWIIKSLKDRGLNPTFSNEKPCTIVTKLPLRWQKGLKCAWPYPLETLSLTKDTSNTLLPYLLRQQIYCTIIWLFSLQSRFHNLHIICNLMLTLWPLPRCGAQAGPVITGGE